MEMLIGNTQGQTGNTFCVSTNRLDNTCLSDFFP
jgi:hypothetical protein